MGKSKFPGGLDKRLKQLWDEEHPPLTEMTDEDRAKWNPRPKKPREKSLKPFIAVDGEGLSCPAGEKQKYVLLAASNGDQVAHPSGLSSEACFDFLLTAGKSGIVIGFGLTYDVNMWCADLNQEQLVSLWPVRSKLLKTGERRPRTAYKSGGKLYLLEYLPKKYFSITRYTYGEKKPDKVMVYDTFSFFGCSFMEAIHNWLSDDIHNGMLSGSIDIDAMKEMKAGRSTFKWEDLHLIAQYNRDELSVLVMMMDKLRQACVDLGIVPSRWMGAGPMAKALMKKHRVKEAMVEDRPPGVWDAQLRAFTAGRIEVVRAGSLWETPIYDYDIVSAYPSGMGFVPTLTGGTWKLERYPGCTLQPYSMIHVAYDFEEAPFYPFHQRISEEDAFGHVEALCYPRVGETWIWYPQWKAYLEHPIEGNVVVQEVWNFYPAVPESPFSFVAGYFKQRQAIKHDPKMKGLSLVIKGALNSINGVLCQSVGTTINPDGSLEFPKSMNIGASGYIMSITRAKLWRAAMQAPHKVIAFQTDGIFTSAPLDVDIGTGLGQWEDCSRHPETGEPITALVMVQAGVYYGLAETACRGECDGSVGLLSYYDRHYIHLDELGIGHHYHRGVVKTRGIDKATASLRMEDFLDAWKNPEKRLMDKLKTRGAHFYGMSVAAYAKSFVRWRTWAKSPLGDGERVPPGHHPGDTVEGAVRAVEVYQHNDKRSVLKRDLLESDYSEHMYPQPLTYEMFYHLSAPFNFAGQALLNSAHDKEEDTADDV